MAKKSYAIIGGGIVGASIAYHLSRETNGSVTLFERQSFASETTMKSWALFGFHGNRHQFDMKRYGLKLYNEFLADPRSNCQYEHVGQLGLATTAEGADAFRAGVEGTVDEYDSITSGVENDLVEFLEPDQIKRSVFTPYLDTDTLEGVLYRPRVGYFRPHELAFEFLDRAEANGVTLQPNTAVSDVLVEDGQVIGVETGANEVEADEVVCAAGPWNPWIADSVGLDIPVRHTLAPVLKVSPKDGLTHTFPFMKHEESRISYRGNPDGTVLIGRNPNEIIEFEEAELYDPATVSETVPAELREKMTTTTETLLPKLAGAPIVEEYVGVRSKTPDGHPVIGRTNLDGFSIAAFNSSGIQLAPAAGRILTDQLVHDDPTDWYDTISITRFDDYEDSF